MYLQAYHNVSCTIPADVTYRQNEITVLGLCHAQIPHIAKEHTQPNASVIEKINKAPDWMKHNWGTNKLTQDTVNTIVRELRRDNICAAGDGSVKRGLVAHSWCLFNKSNFEIIFTSQAIVGGDPTYMTSYRPEASSILAAATLLQIIASTINIQSSTVVFFSDNKEAITNSTKYNVHNVKRVLENDIDVTIEFITAIRKTKLSFIVEHVKGHQDDGKTFDELDPIAKINVNMDDTAGDFIDNLLNEKI